MKFKEDILNTSSEHGSSRVELSENLNSDWPNTIGLDWVVFNISEERNEPTQTNFNGLVGDGLNGSSSSSFFPPLQLTKDTQVVHG